MATANTVKPAASKKVTPRKSAVSQAPKAEVKTPRRAVTAKMTTPATKADAQVVAPKAQAVAKVAGTVVKLFVLLQGARPTSGPRLWSHTQAAFEVLGMDKGMPVNKNALVSVIGQRAVGYHIELSNFEEKGSKVALSDIGKKNFALRTADKRYDQKQTDAFTAMFLKGKESSDYSIRKDNLVPVGLTLR